MKLKKVVKGNELSIKMEEAVNLLCDTVKSTLGPKGSNAIIDHSTFSPFVTNDGVTIAENIESDDECINTILSLAKEASIKTNETVGDGTTTTLVLLQSLFNNGKKLIKEGISPISIKEELLKSLVGVKKEILKLSKIPSKEELKYIATISSNEEEIGNIISDVYLKILNRSAINIKEGVSAETSVTYLKGYVVDAIFSSPYFLKDEKEIILDNSLILLINGHLESLEDIAEILNNILLTKENLLIMANSYNDYLTEQILNINMENDLKIILLNNPMYGLKKLDIYEDLRIISDAEIVTNNKFSLNVLGKVDNVLINENQVLFNFKFNNKIKDRVIELNNALLKSNDSNSLDTEFIAKRLAMFEKGSANIFVGGLTNLERREKKMRFDDALWAISEASKGISVGAGVTLSKISANLKPLTIGDELIKEALMEPVKTILNNAGKDDAGILEKIEQENYNKVYNIKSDKFEEISTTMVLDPTSVLLEEVSNATSIAGMLLTTNSLIINEYQNNLHKMSDFNEL